MAGTLKSNYDLHIQPAIAKIERVRKLADKPISTKIKLEIVGEKDVRSFIDRLGKDTTFKAKVDASDLEKAKKAHDGLDRDVTPKVDATKLRQAVTTIQSAAAAMAARLSPVTSVVKALTSLPSGIRTVVRASVEGAPAVLGFIKGIPSAISTKVKAALDDGGVLGFVKGIPAAISTKVKASLDDGGVLGFIKGIPGTISTKVTAALSDGGVTSFIKSIPSTISTKVNAIIDSGSVDSALGTIGGLAATGGALLATGLSKGATVAILALGAGIAAVTAGVGGLVAGLVASGVAAANMEAGLRQVASLQVPGFGIEEARQAMEDFNAETGLGINKNIPALYEALSSGIPKENVTGFLVETAKLAKAGLADLDPTVKVVTGAMNAYAKSGLDATDASHALLASVQVGVTTLPELAMSLGEVTSVAASAGISFNELNATVATLTLKGIPTRNAVTSVKNLMSELSNSTLGAGEVFKELTGKTFPDFAREGGSLGAALKIMVEEADKANIEFGEFFGGDEARGAALAITNDGLVTFDKTLAAVNETVAEGTAVGEAFDIQQGGLLATLQRLKDQVVAVGSTLGTSLIAPLSSVAGFFEEIAVPAAERFVEVLTATDDRVGRIPDAAIRAEDAFSTFMEPVGDMTGSFVQYGDALRYAADPEGIGALVTNTDAMAASNEGATSSFGTLVALIRDEAIPWATTFGLFLRDTGVPAILSFGAGALEVGSVFITGMVRFIRDDGIPAIQEIIGIVRDEFGPIFGSTFTAALGSITGGEDGGGGLTGGLSAMAAQFTDETLPAVADLAVAFTETVVPAIADFVTWVRDEAIPWTRDAKEKFDEWWPKIDRTATALGDALGEGKDFIDSVLSPMVWAVDAAVDAWGFLKDAIGEAADAIRDFPGAGLIGNIVGAGDGGGGRVSGGRSFGGVLSPGRFETGGIITRPQVAIVGERWKPEIIAPVTDMRRTVDLFQQSGHLDRLVAEISRRQGGTGPGRGSGAGQVVSITSPTTINVTAPDGMNHVAAAREVARQARRGAEAAAAAALKRATARAA